MNVKYEQFIGVYEDAFSKEYCESVISYFEKMTTAGFAFKRQQQENSLQSKKNDLTVTNTDDEVIGLDANITLMQHFNDVLWNLCYLQYANEYWILKELAQHTSLSFRIQKTQKGQGYHVWHCEAASRSRCNRLLVWTLYLNDVEEGGETEFIYQHMRIKPKQGTLVIWPAAFTHTHRGNPPLSGVKYIVTGWIEF